MSTVSEIINKELIKRYKKDKIKQHLLSQKKGKITDKVMEGIEKEVEKFYKENLINLEVMKKITDFIMVQYSDSYDLNHFYTSKNKAKRHKKMSFHITDIQKINSENITSYSFGIKTVKKRKDYVIASDITGLFKVCFSDDTFMYYAKWNSGYGKSRVTEGMFAAEGKVWYRFLKSQEESKKKAGKPKNGTYRIHLTNFGLVYDKLKDLQETPIIHEAVDKIKKDMDFYFGNVPLFTRFGMPGVRKALLVGPPGTGKSSLCVKISKNYFKNKCVVFSTSIADIAAHLIKCAKYDVSTIAVLEDAESTLQQANSALLNFLDGIDQPKNMNGAYIIMTTNFPDKIEPRILKRPGRVDKIIEFGVLKGAYATACAKIYFQDILFNEKNKDDEKLNKELSAVVDGMSGAAIKELAQSTASAAASDGGVDVTVAFIKEVKTKMNKDIKDVMKFAHESSGDSMGFSFNAKDEQFQNNFSMVEVNEAVEKAY